LQLVAVKGLIHLLLRLLVVQVAGDALTHLHQGLLGFQDKGTLAAMGQAQALVAVVAQGR